MRFSKAQLIIKYSISNESSSIYAHIFEHILVSLFENDYWFQTRGAMVFGVTNFDYIDIEIDIIKSPRRLIYDKIIEKLRDVSSAEKVFYMEKNILLREEKLYEETDEERILLSMFKQSLKTNTLSIQGLYKNILKINYSEFIEFINKNIVIDNIILDVDGKYYKTSKYYDINKYNFEVVSCQLKKVEDYCTIILVIPDYSFGKDKINMEVLEYLNFSENHGLSKVLRNEKGLIYSMEHAYVFIQNIYMLIVEIKCESEVLNSVIKEIDNYINNILFENDNFDSIVNYLKVLKNNEYRNSEKQSNNLYHKLTRNYNMKLKDELNALKKLNKDNFHKFLKEQTIYTGVSC